MVKSGQTSARHSPASMRPQRAKRPQRPMEAAEASRMNPVVVGVRQNLEDNLRGFMNGIVERINTYDGALNEALAAMPTDDGSDAPVEAVPQADGKVAVAMPDNGRLLELLRRQSSEAAKLNIVLDAMQDWISFNRPQYANEDDAVVEIMQTVSGQLASFVNALSELTTCELSYLARRSELERMLLKRPTSATVRRQVAVHDQDAWDELERGWRQLMRAAIISHSMVSKNMAKLREPQKRAGGLYM